MSRELPFQERPEIVGCSASFPCRIKTCPACQWDDQQREPSPPACALCDEPAKGHAVIDGQRYCHEEPGTTCYMKAQRHGKKMADYFPNDADRENGLHCTENHAQCSKAFAQLQADNALLRAAVTDAILSDRRDFARWIRGKIKNMSVDTPYADGYLIACIDLADDISRGRHHQLRRNK